MPQGPPPNSYVSHGAIDLSKQTPPHHQGPHHPLPPGSFTTLKINIHVVILTNVSFCAKTGSLGVNQQIMANAGHAGQMQGRQAQGNNQVFKSLNGKI